MFRHTFHFQIQHLIRIISLVLKKKKKKISMVRSWLPVGAFSPAHCVEPCIRTRGHAQIALNDLSKGH